MRQFDTTRWSLVFQARHPSQGAQCALESLCRTYRAPVLGYIRRRGYTEDAAEDLVQTFFTYFIEHAYHADADPARGRFRAFLLTAVKRFLIDSNQEAHRFKRGGEIRFEAIDDDSSQTTIESGETPDAAFERDWAIAVLDAALAHLRTEAEKAGKLALFDALGEFLIERPDEADYERVAVALDMRRNTLAVAVHRMRHRLRELVREEIADTAASQSERDHELRELRAALGAASG